MGNNSIDSLFNIEFFSVMRLPIQFFADRKTALKYGGKNESCVYNYERKTDLKLINLSDENYLSDMPPFNSLTSYEDHIISYFTETTRLALRSNIIKEILYDKLKSINTEMYKKIDGIKDLEVYNWNLNKRLNTSWDDDKYIDILKTASGSVNTQSDKIWEDIILYIISDLKINQSEIWYTLLKKYNIILNTPDQIPQCELLLQSKILEKFPFNTIEYNLENFEHFFNIIYNTEYNKILEEYIQLKVNFINKTLETFNQCFVKKSDQSDIISGYLKSYNKENFILDKLVKEWDIYFEYDLISPKGLWIIINWNRYNEDIKKKRLSWYTIDTLLIYTLINSEYYLKNNYQGWYCENVYEVMIHYPGEYGNLIRNAIPFDHTAANCNYVIN